MHKIPALHLEKYSKSAHFSTSCAKLSGTSVILSTSTKSVHSTAKF